MYQEENIETFQLHHPFGMIIAGPSQSGKTEFVRKFIEHKSLIDKKIDQIYYMYGTYQKRFNDKIPNSNIKYINGFDFKILDNLDGNKATLVVLDDLMTSIANNI